MKTLPPVQKTSLRLGKFDQLADVPPEIEWLANPTNEKARRAYQNDLGLLNISRKIARICSGKIQCQ